MFIAVSSLLLIVARLTAGFNYLMLFFRVIIECGSEASAFVRLDWSFNSGLL